MNLTTKEINSLKATKNESEWNDVCDSIKRARGNQYPPDWWQVVMMSGLAAKVRINWP